MAQVELMELASPRAGPAQEAARQPPRAARKGGGNPGCAFRHDCWSPGSGASWREVSFGKVSAPPDPPALIGANFSATAVSQAHHSAAHRKPVHRDGLASPLSLGFCFLLVRLQGAEGFSRVPENPGKAGCAVVCAASGCVRLTGIRRWAKASGRSGRSQVAGRRLGSCTRGPSGALWPLDPKSPRCKVFLIALPALQLGSDGLRDLYQTEIEKLQLWGQAPLYRCMDLSLKAALY